MRRGGNCFWYNKRMKTLATIVTLLLAVVVRAAPVCVDGVCYPSEEAARADGVSEEKLKAALAEHASATGEAPFQIGRAHV